MHTTWQSTLFHVALFCLITSSIILTSIILKSFSLQMVYSVAALVFLVVAWVCLLISILIDAHIPVIDYLLAAVFLVALIIAVIMEWLVIPFNAKQTDLYKFALSSGVLSLTALVVGIVGVSLWIWWYKVKGRSVSTDAADASIELEIPYKGSSSRNRVKQNYSTQLQNMSKEWQKLMKSPRPY